MKRSGLFSGYDRIEKTDGEKTVCLIDCSSQENSPLDTIIAFCWFTAIVVVIVSAIVRNNKRKGQ